MCMRNIELLRKIINEIAGEILEERKKKVRGRKKRKRKPGGGLTLWGARRKAVPTDALAQGRAALEAADGDVLAAADKLGVAPSTMYLAIQDEPSLERSKKQTEEESSSSKRG